MVSDKRPKQGCRFEWHGNIEGNSRPRLAFSSAFR